MAKAKQQEANSKVINLSDLARWIAEHPEYQGYKVRIAGPNALVPMIEQDLYDSAVEMFGGYFDLITLRHPEVID